MHCVALIAVETEPGTLAHCLHTVAVGNADASRYVPGRQSAHDVNPSPLVTWPGSHVAHALLTRAAEAVPIAQFWQSIKFVWRNFPAAQDTHAALEPSGTVPVSHAVHSVALFPVETEPRMLEHSLHTIAVERSAAAKNLPGLQSLHTLVPPPFVTWPGSQSAHTDNALDEVIVPIPHVLHTTMEAGRVSASRYFPGKQSMQEVKPVLLVYRPSAHVGQAMLTRAAEAVPIAQFWHSIKFVSRNMPAAQETHAA